ncbi:unnamed protein product [Lepeophtheirus salmonis]|uniref:(salmon louse) hypothetical protein n=1 Tax=Lepeophtheirus salmonis TaxID=72036 RepID=A0A7R8CC00_LEPSM|nr:unnamed protein product [Lepeophtheirus salmonis]CAF2758145.1 unnamed protein product [Lepeophtheirus salmonis]
MHIPNGLKSRLRRQANGHTIHFTDEIDETPEESTKQHNENETEKEDTTPRDEINKAADETTTENQMCSGNERREDLSIECGEGDCNNGNSGDNCMESNKEEGSVEDQDSSGAVDIQGIPRNEKESDILETLILFHSARRGFVSPSIDSGSSPPIKL